MLMTPGSIYRNLDNYDYDKCGPYKLDSMQGEALKRGLEFTILLPMDVQEGDLAKGIPTKHFCPKCRREVQPDWRCCPYCCQWIVKKQEKSDV